MIKYVFIGLFLVSLCWSCNQEKSAENVVQLTIEAYGGDRVYASQVDFDFRDKHYSAFYKDGHYQLQRLFEDSIGGIIQDVVNNDGFARTINDSSVILDEEWMGRYSRSVNSVVYFFRIPFVLTDQAVKLKKLANGTIDGQTYYKIETTFGEEGGGDDFDDRFIYWINIDNFNVDYFGYSYSTDGGGKRFRKAMNYRKINGWLMADYINYEPNDLTIPLDEYDVYFKEGGMKELSIIENENIVVEYF
jgi:hypothetical protein